MEHLISKIAARVGRRPSENASADRERARTRRLLVVGVGSAGCAAAEWTFEDTPGAATVTVNTDRISLEIHKSETKVLLGERIFQGHGAQGHADAAGRAAREASNELAELMKGFDIVAVLTALGGGTGTGAAPVVAAVAREGGAAVVAVAVLPLRAERARRERAVAALRALKREAHTTILLDTEALLPIAGHLPVATALGVMDYFMAEVPRALVRAVELNEAREEAQREARNLVLTGGLGTLVYGEWRGAEGPAHAQHALLEPSGGAPNCVLIHMESHDGRPPLGHERVLGEIAARLGSDLPPADRVRLSVSRDASIDAGGSLVSLVTGISDPCIAARDAPGVSLEPARVVDIPKAPGALPVEERAAAEGAAVDLAPKAR